MTPEIKTFLKQLLVDAGQTDMAPAVEEVMIEDLNNRLEDTLILTAMQKLPVAKQKELEQMAMDKEQAGQKAATVETFLKQNIPNYQQVFTQALIDFRNTYVQASKS